MKRGATKEEIIRTTQDLITRNGIRAVRVDEIAQTLGISKRTLYEMFTDKNDLVSACLEAMSHQQRERIVACRKRRGGNPLQKVLRLTNEYIDNLYTVDHRFLSDISRIALSPVTTTIVPPNRPYPSVLQSDKRPVGCCSL